MSDEILAVLTDISGKVGTIDGKLDGIKGAFDSHLAQDLLVQTKIFDRLGSLELAHAQTAAAAAAKIGVIKAVAGGVGAASGILGTIVVKLWPWHH